MAGIPVQDELTPMGNYYLIRAKNVDVDGVRLDKVINQVKSSIEAIKTDFYTKEQSDAKYASKSDLATKEDDIKHFRTWAEYETAKATIPAGAMFVVDEDNPENKIPKHNLLDGRDEANAHPYTAIEGLQAQLDKKTDVAKTQTLESRMNQFAKLPSGSTAGDAELADIRVGADGKTYDQAGEAVRGQITSLKETLEIFDGLISELSSKVNLSLLDDIPSGSDLDDCKTTGYTILSYSAAYVNEPFGANNRRLLVVYAKGAVYAQKIINLFTSYEYTRVCVGGVWSEWQGIPYPDDIIKNKHDIQEFNCYDLIPYFCNFEDLSTKGIKWKWNGDILYANGTSTGASINDIYSNFSELPIEIKAGHKYSVFWNSDEPKKIGCRIGFTSDGTKNIWQNMSTGENTIIVPDDAIGMTVRIWIPNPDITVENAMSTLRIASTISNNMISNELTKLDNRVTALEENPEASDTNITHYNNSEIVSTRENKGVEINVLSYNVAHYNNDTANYISDEKIANFKKMLYKTKPDFIGLQENSIYIDGDSKSFINYLYAPALVKSCGGAETAIVSRITAKDPGNRLYLTGGRSMYYATFEMQNGKILLFISAHPVSNYNGTGRASAESIDMRIAQYNDIFKWVTHEISIRTYASASEMVSAPTWDYCIITMDGNCHTDTDKANLKEIATGKGFTLGNGGYLGWFDTCYGGGAKEGIDNIIVSNQCIINSVESLETMHSRLYSDHFPQVANITLLD